MKYFTRLRVRRLYEWRGKPVGFNRKLKTHEYGGLSIRVEGVPRVTQISLGQHILIEGDDEDHPYVAKVLKLFGDDDGQEKKAVVQWFVRVSEIPPNKLKLLGREPHPNEVFHYEGANCDNEVNAESILRPAQVVQVAGSFPFPSSSDSDTFFVKLSWDSRRFRVFSEEALRSPSPRAASPPPSPLAQTPPGSVLRSPDSAPRSPPGLPAPDLNMIKAASALSTSKRRPQEAESLHSASKLSASKCLSARRRGLAGRTPGVRKKLHLFAPEDSSLDSDLDQLLAEDLQSDGVRACFLPGASPAPRRSLPTPRRAAEEGAESVALKQTSVRLKRLSQDDSPSSFTSFRSWSRSRSRSRSRSLSNPKPLPRSKPVPELSPDQPDSEEAQLPQTPVKRTPRRASTPRGQKASTPYPKGGGARAVKEPALAVLAELEVEDSPLQVALTPRSQRKCAELVSSRIKKQLSLLSGRLDLDSDSEEEFVPPNAEPSSEEEELMEEEEPVKRRRRGSAATPRSGAKTSARTPHKMPRKVTPSTPRTPRHATPSIPSRCEPAKGPRNALEEARARLHVSSVPESLPCREQEFQDIYSFVESKIIDGTGGCMYISGVPGTGKTATVHEVIRCLQSSAENAEIPTFTFIEINGMKMTDPHQAYVQILQKLTGQKATTDHAASLLEKRFSSPTPRKETTVLLVDELDLLWTRKQNVMYNLFDWPTRRHARLVVLTIANTMDLPERIMINRVASRLGLTRMSFQPYTFKQLQQIISSRLNRIKAFEEDALQLVSRKVAALSGDARRCLDICRRATEICEHSGGRLVEMGHVMEALGEMFSSAYVSAIRRASLQEQIFLRAVVAEFRRLGLEEATFQQVFVQQVALCRVEGVAPVSVSEGLSVCLRLGALRILLLEPSRTDLLLRVRLNVSQDDVLYALKAE